MFDRKYILKAYQLIYEKFWSIDRALSFLKIREAHKVEAFLRSTIIWNKNIDFLLYELKLYKNKPKKNILYILKLAILELVFWETPYQIVINEWVKIAPYYQKGFINAILRKIHNTIQSKTQKWFTIPILPKLVEDGLKRIFKNEYYYTEFKKMLDIPSPFLWYFNKTQSLQKLSRDELNKKTFIKNIYIQNIAAQKISYILFRSLLKVLKLSNENNVFFWDVGAYPGGKTIHVIIKILQRYGKLPDNLFFIAIDSNKEKEKLFISNLKKFGLEFYLDNKIYYFTEAFDSNKLKKSVLLKNKDYLRGYHIAFIDAPCSSIGTILHNPEVLIRIDRQANTYIDKYALSQKRLLNNVLNFFDDLYIKYLFYSVCTFTKEETINQKQYINSIIKAQFKSSLQHSIDKFYGRKNLKLWEDIHYLSIFY